jgi:hypothetical protein
MNNTFYVLDDQDGFFFERRRLEEVLALATISLLAMKRRNYISRYGLSRSRGIIISSNS